MQGFVPGKFAIPSTKGPCSVKQFIGKRATLVASLAEKDSQKNSSKDFYEESDIDGYFPKRQPGDFPKIGHHHHEKEGAQANVVALQVADDAAPPFEEVEFDPLRDGPARYLGYANELGEAFRAWLPGWGVPASYAVAIAYVVTDTFDKAIKANQQARADLVGDAELAPEVDVDKLVALITAERFVDTLIWQLLASVAVPGFTIHTVVDIVHHGLELAMGGGAQGDLSALPPAMAAFIATAATTSGQSQVVVFEVVEKSVPTMAGLATIPFIVHPIDNLIHWVLNKSLRPALKSYICGPGQGSLAELDMCEDCQQQSNGSH